MKFSAEYIIKKISRVSGKIQKVKKIYGNYDATILYFEYFNVNHTILLNNKVRLIIIKEGGLLNHALIVAKEFGINAIIGTKDFDNIKGNSELDVFLEKKEFLVK